MYKLLFVDDEALIREGVSENIRWNELGYELAAACENGKEACDFLKEHPVDVVVTDICMPFVDGLELSAFVQKEYPQTKVLILSGYDDFSYAKRAIQYGVEEYLLKPVTSYDLSEVLTRLRKKLDKEREKEKKNTDIYTAYRKGQLLRCSDALLHTITGSKTENECRRELADVEVELPYPWYRVGVAGLSIYSGDYELNEKRKKESALMAFIVYNLANEIMQREKAGEACQGKDNRVFLLFGGEHRPEEDERIADICHVLIDQVSEAMGLSLNIGLGDWQKGLGNIYRSYELAEKGLLLQYCIGEGCIIDAEEHRRMPDCMSQAERIADNFLRHVREDDWRKLSEDCRELKELLQRNGYSRREASDCLLNICGRTERALENMGAGRGTVKETAAILTAPSLEQAMEQLLSFGQEAAQYLNRETGSSSRNYAYQGYEYIEKHYGESSLCLQDVCRHLNVSTSHFSSAFKQTFGSTFMDVLIGIRMQKARELLAMTEFKNYEIAEKVGFSDPHYFGIAFKKATGMTPTEYARERKG